MEPYDESPIETPPGWVGGRVKHTGGNIFVREWRNEYIRIQVGYGMNPIVGAAFLINDEEYGLMDNGDLLAEREPDENTDEAKWEAAKQLIEYLH
jgi:hypothetical protein